MKLQPKKLPRINSGLSGKIGPSQQSFENSNQFNQLDGSKQIMSPLNNSNKVTSPKDHDTSPKNKNQKSIKKYDDLCFQPDIETKNEYQNLSQKGLNPEFLKIVEMDVFEKLIIYHDEYPLLNFRKKVMWLRHFISYCCFQVIKHKAFEAVTLSVILCNSVVLCFSDPTVDKDTEVIEMFEFIFLILYTIEMGLKVIGLGFILNKGSYIRDLWNILDFIIVTTAYIPYILTDSGGGFSLSSLRALRILRPLRTISSVKALKVLIQAFLQSLPMLCDTFAVLMFVFLIFAIGGLQLFQGLLKKRCFNQSTGETLVKDDEEIFCSSSSCPEYYICGRQIANPNGGITNFDNILYSMLQVFQITTLEGWTQIQDILRTTFSDFVILYFVLLIFLGNFFVMNMMLAVIKAKFTEVHENQESGQDKKVSNEEESSSDDDSTPFSYTVKELSEHAKFYQHFRRKRYYRHKQAKQTMDEDIAEMQRLKNAKSLENSQCVIVGKQLKSQSSNNAQIDTSHVNLQKNDPLDIQDQDEVIQNNKEEQYAQLSEEKSLKNKAVQNNYFQNEINKKKSKSQKQIEMVSNTAPLYPKEKQQSIQKQKTEQSIDKLPPKEKQKKQQKESQFQEKIESKPLPYMGIDTKDQTKRESGQPSKFGSVDNSFNNFINDFLKPIQIPNKDIKYIDLLVQSFSNKIQQIPDLGYLRQARSQQQEINQLISYYFETEQYSDGDEIQIEEEKKEEDEEKKMSKKMRKKLEQIQLEHLKSEIHFHDHEEVFQMQANIKDIFENREKAQQLQLKEQRQKDIENRIFQQIYKYLAEEEEKKEDEQQVQTKEENEQEFDTIYAKAIKQINKERKLKVIDSMYYKPKEVDILKSEDSDDDQTKDDLQSPMKVRRHTIRENRDLLNQFMLNPELFNQQNESQRQISKAKEISTKEKKEIKDPFLHSLTHVRSQIQMKSGQIRPRSRQYTPKQNLATSMPLNSVKTQAESLNNWSDDDQEQAINQKSKKDQILHKIGKILKQRDKEREIITDIRTQKQVQILKEQQEDGIRYLTYEKAQQLVNQQVIKGQDKKAPENQNNNERKYQIIKDEEFLSGFITHKNWSTKNVWINYNKRNKKHINRILQKMNDQDSLIWLGGFMGLLNSLRKYLKMLVENQWFENIIIISVVLNTWVLAMDGLMTDSKSVEVFDDMNLTFTIIFTVEMGLKLMAYGAIGYVKDTMNIFDGAIVIISLVELIFLSGGNKAVQAFRSVRIFRTFRVLRVTKLLRSLAFMKVIIGVVSRSIDSFEDRYVLFYLLNKQQKLSLSYKIRRFLIKQYIFAGELNVEGWPELRTNYETIESSFLTTFQMLTLENWQQILYYTMKSDVNQAVTIIYLMSWIFAGNFSLLNLFLAILLDGFTSESAEKDLNDAENEADEGDEQNEEQIQLVQKQDDNLSDDFNISDIEEHVDNFNQEQQKKNKLQKYYKSLGCQDSIFIFAKKNKFRKICFRIIQWHYFETIILVLIILSSVKLAVDTYFPDEPTNYEEEQYKKVSAILDYIFNVSFAVEMCLKVISLGFVMDNYSYLRDSWNQMDFIIVVSSLIDMSVSGVNLQAVKILRMMRTLRPLRFVSHNVNMKIVVTALLSSTGAITNVLIVVFLIYLMFAILGMSLLANKYGYCDVTDRSFYGINKESCDNLGEKWLNRDVNFDHVGHALISLFVIGSLEGWPDLMFQAIDGRTPDEGPQKDNSTLLSLYFVCFILIGAFFFLNLFIGAICYHFDKCQKSEKCSMYSFLSEEQIKWIEMQKLILKAKPDFTKFFIPESQWRLKLYHVVNGNKFDVIIMICILLNILSMALSFEGQSDEYGLALEGINYFFTTIFFLEAALKIIAMGIKGYWMSGWNQFDFFVVLASIIDIIMGQVLTGGGTSFLRVGPQLARVVRVLRVSRLLKLVKSFQGLQKIIETMMISLPSLLNVGALILLVLFIYSVLGVFLFSEVKQGNSITDYTNFWDFHNALVTLFRAATGEDWFVIMFDVGRTEDCTNGVDCGSQFSSLFFLTFIMMTTFVMLNLFILIILNDFEEFNLKTDNPVEQFKENLESFRASWVLHTQESKGQKIKEKKLVPFFMSLNPPLGFGEGSDKKEITKNVAKMKIHGDVQGNVFFNELLFVSMRRSFGEKIAKQASKEILTYIAFEESTIKKQIYDENRERQYRELNEKKISGHERTKTLQKLEGNLSLNPFITTTFVRMCFCSWLRYSGYIREKQQSPNDRKPLYNFMYNNRYDGKRSDSFSESSQFSADDAVDYHRQQNPIPPPQRQSILRNLQDTPQGKNNNNNSNIMLDRSEPDPEDFSMMDFKNKMGQLDNKILGDLNMDQDRIPQELDENL